MRQTYTYIPRRPQIHTPHYRLRTRTLLRLQIPGRRALRRAALRGLGQRAPPVNAGALWHLGLARRQ